MANTANGSVVSRSCSVQTKEKTLNVPRFLIKAIGWNVGDSISVTVNGTVIKVSRESDGKQKVDQEGRIRIHGETTDVVKTSTPTAWIAEPSTGEKYIEISATITSKSDTGDNDIAPVDDSDTADSKPAVAGAASVWDH